MNVWPGKEYFALFSLHQRIRSRGRALAKMEIRAARSPPVSTDRSLSQVSRLPFDCQAIFLSPPADCRDYQLNSRCPSLSYADMIAGSKLRSLRSTAQTIRASLAASATTTTFLYVRSDRLRAHGPNGVS